MEKTTKKIGDLGEDRAAEYLEKMGYEILCRNWRNRFGEIDIIAKENDCVVFIEVKAKTSTLFGSPGEMITVKKLSKIKNAALTYLDELEHKGAWRIDAILILNNNLEHLQNITL